MRIACLVVLSAAASACLAQEPILRTLDPALSPDGKTLAFQWQGDIWTVPAVGGMATRLTVNPAIDEAPVWTPDGRSIVFASNRTGNSDVYVMAADGTDVRRVTYTSGTTLPYSISADGKTVYGQTNAFGRTNTFRASLAGGEAVRLTLHPLEIQFNPEVSPDGSRVVFCSGGSAGLWRKPGHHGSNTPELWTGTPTAPLSNLAQITHNDWLDMYPRFVSNDTLVFMSNRNGAHNVWYSRVDGKDARPLTKFTDGTIRALTFSRVTSQFAFQRNSRIYLGDLNGRVNEVKVFAPQDSRRPRFQPLTLSSGIGQFQASPNGKRLVFEMRGDIFVAPESGGTTRQLTKNPGFDGQPAWLNDKDVLYTTGGQTGTRSVHKVTVDGADTVYVEGARDVFHPVPSPDRNWVAMNRGDDEVVVVPAAGGTPTVVLKGRFNETYDGPAPFSWSPDNEWLVVNSTNDRGGSDIVMVKRDGSSRILLTRVGKSASPAQFLPNGKGVFFVGTEGLDFSEARDTKSPLYVVDLVPDPVTYSEDDLEKLDDTPTKDDPKVVVKVVEKGLKDRRRRVLPDVQGAWLSPDGKSFLVNVGNALMRVPTAPSTAAATPRPVAGVTGAVQAVVAGAKGRTLFRQGGKVYALGAGPEATATPVNLNARITIDNRAEERALFNEVWWALDRQYYDTKLHGKDWKKIHDEFEPIVAQVTSRDDFYNLMGEMVERLDSSHQGANTSEPFRAENPQPVAWLGVDFDASSADAGRNVVTKVYANTPAAHPDSELRPGDEIISVNGVAPSASTPLGALLVDQAGRKVVLGIRRNGADAKVTIKPLPGGAKTEAMYDDWVAYQRAETSRLSNGTLAYTHVRSMDAPSLDQFLADIQNETVGKKGIIVDVRFNGGGFTSHIILNIMRKTPWLQRTYRDWPGHWISENVMRGNSLELPAACLTNEYSFSNAEIFSEGFRRMGLGPVIGEPTGGGVIGTGAFGLWDGGSIRMPGIGVFTIEGENLEGNGRKPDFNVDYDPIAWSKGRDAQLERAVAELMKRVK